MTEHGCSCSCSACVAARRTPGVFANRPGLAQIAYRSGTHADFLSAMRDALPTGDGSALSGLRTRDADDPTIALLDAWAVACDVLTFYSERLANEAYLGTATDRVSLQELGALVAYRLGRGAAAEATLAFAMERPPVLPAAGADPGSAPPPTPTELSLPAGLRVRSVPAPGEKPQTFETVEEIQARPDWNALPIAQTALAQPGVGSPDGWFDTEGPPISVGDMLLFLGAPSDTTHATTAAATSVEVDHDAHRTHVTWDHLLAFTDALPAAVTPQVHLFRRRLALFGASAPSWNGMSDEFKKSYKGDTAGSEWPAFSAATTSGSSFTLDLDGSHPDVTAGSWILVVRDAPTTARGLYKVQARAELSRSAFAVSGRVTRLTIAGTPPALGTPRDAVVFAVPEKLTVAEAPDTSSVSGAALLVDGDATAMAVGRSILLAGETADGPSSEPLVVAGVVAAGSGRTLITVDTAPEGTYVRAGAVVYGNVARATHGETVGQLLGSGDARRSFQAARLTQSPLTFVRSEDPRGTSSTLRVRVDGVAWTELATTAIAGARDRVFQTRDEPDGGVSVVFGDGVHGARPSTGSHNIRAEYRVGVGAAGNVAAGALALPVDRPLGLKGVTNPAPASGGVDPETRDRARRSIPVPVRTLGRAVSLQDFADFALAFTGIGMARAVVRPVNGIATVILSVADDDGMPPPARVRQSLSDELARFGDPTAVSRVVACRAGTFRVGMRVGLAEGRRAEDVLPAVEALLRDQYAAPVRGIGRPVHRSAVIASAASVPGVAAIDLELLYRSGTVPHRAPRLNPATEAVWGATVLGAEVLALSGDPFDQLEVIA